MAGVALTNVRVRLIGDSLRDHRKMLHIMARRCLMALGAILRARAGVLKRRNRPLVCGVAGSTVLIEQSEVFVFRRVAGSAVETGFERRDERMTFRQKRVVRLMFNVRPARSQIRADSRQRFVVHPTQIRVRAPVFDVAGGAVIDICVKGGRLSLKKRFVIGVAADTFRFVNALNGGMAGGAIRFKLRVSGGQFARHHLALPPGGVGARVLESDDSQRRAREQHENLDPGF